MSSDLLQHSIEEIDRDLASSWIELSDRVSSQSAALKNKVVGTVFSDDADRLAQDAALLCDHVKRIHADVQEFMEKLEMRIPNSAAAGNVPDKVGVDELEWMRIQRENHELRADFMDVIKALFMWRDDPRDRSDGS